MLRLLQFNNRVALSPCNRHFIFSLCVVEMSASDESLLNIYILTLPAIEPLAPSSL